jgi:caa(3)-type oxidase subunit IV
MKIIRPHLFPLLGLLLLLALTAASSFVPMGPGNLATTLAISIGKTGIIAFYFMELRKAGTLLRLTAFVGLMWLMIYLMLVLSDYATRFPGTLEEKLKTAGRTPTANMAGNRALFKIRF